MKKITLNSFLAFLLNLDDWIDSHLRYCASPVYRFAAREELTELQKWCTNTSVLLQQHI